MHRWILRVLRGLLAGRANLCSWSHVRKEKLQWPKWCRDELGEKAVLKFLNSNYHQSLEGGKQAKFTPATWLGGAWKCFDVEGVCVGTPGQAKPSCCSERLRHAPKTLRGCASAVGQEGPAQAAAVHAFALGSAMMPGG